MSNLDLEKGRLLTVWGNLNGRAGLAIAARALMGGVEASGLPYRAFSSRISPPNARFQFPVETQELPSADVAIYCCGADELDLISRRHGREVFARSYNVGFWFWETAVRELPDWMRRGLEYLDEVWVASQHIRDVLAPISPKPVHYFPLPIEEPTVSGSFRRSNFGLPDGRFVFLFCFDFAASIERKNPLFLIEAFKKAFPPNEGPILVIKSVNGREYTSSFEKLELCAGDREDIHLLDAYISTEQLTGLTATCDCYVSFHRTEGYGLTMSAAMALGKPVIGTGYSGNVSFMTEENSYLCKFRLVDLDDRGSQWADPDFDDAVRLLRHVVENPEEAKRKGELARQDVREKHSLAVAADFVRRRVGEIAEERAASSSREAGSLPPGKPQPAKAGLKTWVKRDDEQGSYAARLRKKIIRIGRLSVESLMRPTIAYLERGRREALAASYAVGASGSSDSVALRGEVKKLEETVQRLQKTVQALEERLNSK